MFKKKPHVSNLGSVFKLGLFNSGIQSKTTVPPIQPQPTVATIQPHQKKEIKKPKTKNECDQIMVTKNSGHDIEDDKICINHDEKKDNRNDDILTVHGNCKKVAEKDKTICINNDENKDNHLNNDIPTVHSNRERVARKDAMQKNKEIVQRACCSRPWFAPDLSFSSEWPILTFAAVFVLLTCLYFYVHTIFSSDPYEYLHLYAQMFGTVFVIVAFYILMSATAANYLSQRIISTDTVEQQVLVFLGALWPLTDRLLKEMYHCDPLIQKLVLPPGTDENWMTFTEVVASRLIFSNIDVTVRQEPIQDCGKMRLWRQWFESKILQEAWAYSRGYYKDATVYYVDQNLFPQSRCPKPSRWSEAMKNPIQLIADVILALTLVAVVIYWTIGVHYLDGTLFQNTELFVEFLKEFYLSAALVAIVFDNAITTEDVIFNFEYVVNDLNNTTLVSSYPHSVPLYRAFYPCDKMLQAVRIPPNLDANTVTIYNFSLCHGLFQAICTSLELNMPPNPESLRLWRSNFMSSVVRKEWRASKNEFNEKESCYIQTEIYDKAGCESFFIPEDYVHFQKC
jgi:hypothetical protein